MAGDERKRFRLVFSRKRNALTDRMGSVGLAWGYRFVDLAMRRVEV